MIKIHPASDVQSSTIGEGTYIWQYAVVLSNAVIGSNCNINCHTFIENDVVIGDNVTVKAGVYLWDGLRVADNVFIGPNATFVNDKYPRSKQYPGSFLMTYLQEGCSVGAGSIILGNITIGKYAIIAAGAVVTKDVPPNALVKGNPGKIVGWVDKQGNKLIEMPDGKLKDIEENYFLLIDGNLVQL